MCEVAGQTVADFPDFISKDENGNCFINEGTFLGTILKHENVMRTPKHANSH